MEKNILFIVHSLKMGGIQKMTVALARYHQKQGNNVVILTLEKGDGVDIDFPCKVINLSLSEYLMYRPHLAVYYLIYKVLLRYLLPRGECFFAKFLFKPLIEKHINELESESGKFDAIFVRGARSLYRTWWMNASNVVFSFHLPFEIPIGKSSFNERYWKYWTKKLLSGKKVFCVSNFILKDLMVSLKKKEVDLHSSEVIHNPIDLQRLQLLSKKGSPVEGDYIISVGRLTKQKRFDVLIESYAMSKLPCKLVILGEGNQRDNIESLINKYNLHGKVLLPGFDGNPYRWLDKAKFFVLSSDVEGFGNVVLEALACGLPVVSTNNGPVGEILKGPLANGIVPCGDVEALSTKMQEYWDSPVYPDEDDISTFTLPYITSQQMELASN